MVAVQLRSWAVALLVLVATPLEAMASQEGTGRVTAEVGWRLTPNNTFYADALAAGLSKAHDSIGGPVAMASFGFMATEELEISIDLFAGGERLFLNGLPPFNSVSYGGVAGPRYHLPLGPFAFAEDWQAFAGVMVGTTLVLAVGGNIPATAESAVGSYLGSLGLTARLSDELGLTFEYRLLLARGYVPGIGGLNGGGSWFGVGLTWYVAAQPSLAPSPHM